MNDLDFGTVNKRGDFKPSRVNEITPLWHRPFSLTKVLKWIPDYIWPWNTLHMVTALLYWFFVLPDLETMKTASWDWGLWLYFVNACGVFLLYGSVEFFYYVKRIQGQKFKYNGKFPADNPSDVFWFGSQNIDNFLRSFLITIPIWTAVEVFMLWYYANGFATWLSWADHPLYLAFIVLLVPAIHEVHFFCIHRAIHWGPLYKWVHSIHHNSINPTPWSSLSMHPVEGFLFVAQCLWHLVIPSNPIIALFQLHQAGFGAINGHIGFDKLEVTENSSIPSEAYTHYLHHKYFEVNYGADGLIPLDKWFGTWHDGTKEGDELMYARLKKKMKPAAS
jgi:sterol desaturase/sphingolipid hydroxylase (fatty acid hydroxylase superfamily)